MTSSSVQVMLILDGVDGDEARRVWLPGVPRPGDRLELEEGVEVDGAPEGSDAVMLWRVRAVTYRELTIRRPRYGAGTKIWEPVLACEPWDDFEHGAG